MPDERRNEKAARWIVAQVLGCPVPRYEDGRSDSQVDAQILLPNGPAGLEIVSDQDPIFNGQWAALEKVEHKVLVPGLQRRWTVSLTRQAKVKRVVKALPALMLRLERGEITWPRWGAPEEFADIGVTSAWPIDDERSGVVHLTAEGWGGIAGDPMISPWLEEMFARHADVPRKLAAHPTPDGHAFIWVTTRA